MSRNQMRDHLAADNVVLGARSETFTIETIDAYGDLGLEFVWLDLEHSGPSPYNAQALDPLVRGALAADIELLVRVPTAEPAVIHKVLDTGVTSLLIPRVETADEVRQAVASTRFSNDGSRHRGYGGAPPGWGDESDFTTAADDSVLVGAMIEHERAVENIEAILDVSGLGFIFIGANDLAISMGYPGNPDHPDVQDTIATVEEAARAANVPFGAPKHDLGAAEEAINAGYQVLRIGDEIDAIHSAVGDRLSTLDQQR